MCYFSLRESKKSHIDVEPFRRTAAVASGSHPQNGFKMSIKAKCSREAYPATDKVRVRLLDSFRRTEAVGMLLLALVLVGCRKPLDPITITFLDPEGLLDLGAHRMVSEEYLQEFTQQTGIRVNHLPTPQDNRAQLQLAKDLLQSGASSPDVYGVDTIWSGTLGQYLIDLNPYFSPELSQADPEVRASYTVQGKLVAIPYHPNLGVLYYRADLLHRYGYNRPPRTWDELEKMALRIQNGERARGDKKFWGFVWPGTDSEPLSCMGVEWLVGNGGGRIVEADGKISINNPNAIQAWERAARWVGWISPPSVLSYTDWDIQNTFWVSGESAFIRGWADYFQLHPSGTPYRQKAGVTSVPAGKKARVSTLGGYALAVSQKSSHRAEAIKFVQFLTKREARFEADYARSKQPDQLEFYELPIMLLKRYPSAKKADEILGGKVVSRPSAVTGQNYSAVSLAYVEAVRSVLLHKSTAPAAAAALEKKLVRITGFEALQR
jgi:trehalose/maltose transport system substrate-binding protein